MKPEYTSFTTILREVVRYHFDSTITESAPEDLYTSVAISDEEFLRDLYQPRKVEETLKRRLRETDELVCLVGPRGSGKSSIGLKVMHDLRHDPGQRMYMFRIDMRLFSALKPVEQTSDDEFRHQIRQRIIDNYKSELFSYPDGQHRLNAFLFEKDRLGTRKPFQIFSNYIDLENAAALHFALYLRQHPAEKGQATLYDWLKSEHLGDAEVISLMRRANDLVDVPHVVYAARFLFHYDRQIIWFDNIDALPEGQQSQLVAVINQLYQLIHHHAWVLVSVREENVFRQYDLSDAGAPIAPSRVMLEIPRDARQHAYYPSCDLPVASNDTLKRIVLKRLDFTRSYQRQRAEKITTEITALSDPSAESDKAYREARRKILAGHLSQCSPLISDLAFDHIKRLIDKILVAFEDEKAIYIANNCVRDLLPIVRDFMAFLLKSPNEDAEFLEALAYEDWHISTLFLMFMRHTRRNFHLGIYDAIELMETWYAQKKQSIGCFLPYLIVTTLWNLTLANRSQNGNMYSTPQIADVIEKLALLGYSKDDVLKGIHMLYFQDGSRSKLVEVRSKALLPNWTDLDERLTVYATYRGKCLVAYTGNSFGYIYECTRFRNAKDEVFQSHPDMRNTEAFASEMLGYLCDIAEMHIATLWRIRQDGKLGGVEWLNNYYLYFGLPQVDPYARSTRVGRVLTGDIHRALHFEALMSSLLGYVRVGAPREKLIKLQRLYQDNLMQLEAFSLTGAIDEAPATEFRRELNLRKRRA